MARRSDGSRIGVLVAVATALALVVGSLAGAAASELAADTHGAVLSLPPPSPHWVWLPDRLLRHSKLFDGDSGRVLGIVDGTWSPSGRLPIVSLTRGEVYVVEAVYARGHRGARRDFVTIYDLTTLAVVDEIEIPPRTADVGHGVALVALADDERFLAAFNQDPSNSVSIVDLETRRFVEEIIVAGCALVYPTGPRSFGTLCGNGTALVLDLDAEGHQARQSASAPFFDVVEDPLTEKGVRDGARWLFASFDGWLHEIDFTGVAPALTARWSLFDDAARADGWRIGGAQHLALHRATGRLYSLVHRGGPGSHKDPGSQIWVYDRARQARVQVIEPASLLPAFLRPLLDVAPGGWADWLLGMVLPDPGVHSIAVTQDETPLLFVRHDEIGAVGVYDARAGGHVRDLEEVGITGPLIGVPGATALLPPRVAGFAAEAAAASPPTGGAR